MNATMRWQAEQEFHDAQALERKAWFRDHGHSLQFADETFLDHETWIRPAVAALGDLSGKTVLDYGCGHGMAAVTFARRGGIVTGFDLSPEYVQEATLRAEANAVSARFLVANAEQLPFADASFDCIWGNAILHHLHLPTAARELERILKPGGIAVFCEPCGGNPLLEFARRKLPYPGKHRTVDEQPLRWRDLAPLRETFPNMSVRGYQFLNMLRRVCRVPLLETIDRGLLRAVPQLEKWCRYLVIVLPRS